MKKNKLKIITITFLIILITMIAFFGIYVQVQNRMENKVKDYEFAMDLKGTRKVTLEVNKGTKEVIKDKDGNIVESATDEEIAQNGYTKEEILNNSEEVLTVENYNLTKKIIEERLNKLEIGNYITKLNEKTGEIVIELTENDETDNIVSNINTIGKLEITDTDTKEVLLNNNDIKTCDVNKVENYGSTSVYFTIEFNKDGKKKLEEITKTYVPQEDTNETTETTDTATEKTITMKIDDSEVMSTSFDEPITDGKMQLSVGQASTDKEDIKENEQQAKQMSAIISKGNMPIKYDVSGNTYVVSDITKDTVNIVVIGGAIVLAIALIVLVVRYKLKGILAVASYIGLLSIFLLTIRYTNVVLSIEGVLAIFVILILNYVYSNKILSSLKKEEKDKKANTKHIINIAIKEISIKIIPICILSIVFCFMGWVPTSSFGMVMFWGITLIILYNLLITKNLLKYSKEK